MPPPMPVRHPTSTSTQLTQRPRSLKNLVLFWRHPARQHPGPTPAPLQKCPLAKETLRTSLVEDTLQQVHQKANIILLLFPTEELGRCNLSWPRADRDPLAHPQNRFFLVKMNFLLSINLRKQNEILIIMIRKKKRFYKKAKKSKI